MSDAAELVTVTFGGKTFECTRRTIAHLSWTDEQLRAKGKSLRVIQGSYNRGVAASAGTHDYDAVFDVGVMGLEWPAAQKVLRELGWAAWWRQPPTFSHHIHMISLGYPGQVGVFVPGQVADYYAHRSGLSGHVADSSWHPADIDSTIFDYPAWVADQEDAMKPEDWTRLESLFDERIEASWQKKLGNDVTRETNLRKAGDAKEIARELKKELGK